MRKLWISLDQRGDWPAPGASQHMVEAELFGLQRCASGRRTQVKVYIRQLLKTDARLPIVLIALPRVGLSGCPEGKQDACSARTGGEAGLRVF